MISIIVPCLNEEEVLPLFYQSVEALLLDLGAEVEYVFVDDGSTMGLRALKTYRGANPAVRYVSFSRNFWERVNLIRRLAACNWRLGGRDGCNLSEAAHEKRRIHSTVTRHRESLTPVP